ncbi:MAG TPA: DMT family transporter [Burkholderiales bacterium]|nr:DMT family transporter [Burkholderiales bacterium]
MQSLWMLAAGLLFACMGVFVKLGSPHFSSAELVFYRSVIGLATIFAVTRHLRLSLATRHWKMHLSRSISGFIAILLYFYAISALPLATAVTLNYTSPLFLALLTTFWLKERAHWPLVLAVILGFIGIVLLLRPTFNHDQFFAGCIGLVSGFLAGIAYLNIKQLANMGEPEWRVVFYFSLLSTIGAGLWTLLSGFHSIDQKSLLILLGLGGSATLAQLAMTRAYGRGKAMVSGALAYSTVVFASLFGIALWGEVLSVSGWLAIGLIAAGGVLSIKAAPPRGMPDE